MIFLHQEARSSLHLVLLMIKAYKLLRLRRDNSLGPLFVGRDLEVPLNTWLTARSDLKHPGLKHRPGFHCCCYPFAPHLKLKLSSGEVRVWAQVEIEDWSLETRPASQGGLWYLAKRMRVIKVL